MTTSGNLLPFSRVQLFIQDGQPLTLVPQIQEGKQSVSTTIINTKPLVVSSRPSVNRSNETSEVTQFKTEASTPLITVSLPSAMIQRNSMPSHTGTVFTPIKESVVSQSSAINEYIIQEQSSGDLAYIPAEDSAKKREVRLMKNREAARECRRKKKEYVKCLENRVAVLENQNKLLIEELKTLKKLYCQNADQIELT